MSVAYAPSATFAPPAMALDALPVVGPPTATRRRLDLLAVVRRPSRVAQLEQLLNRYRWANAGLRDRYRDLTACLDAIEAITDETARHLGHAHPAVRQLRAELAKVRP